MRARLQRDRLGHVRVRLVAAGLRHGEGRGLDTVDLQAHLGVGVRARDAEDHVVVARLPHVHRVLEPLARPDPADHRVVATVGQLHVHVLVPVDASEVRRGGVVVAHVLTADVVVLCLDHPGDHAAAVGRRQRRRKRQALPAGCRDRRCRCRRRGPLRDAGVGLELHPVQVRIAVEVEPDRVSSRRERDLLNDRGVGVVVPRVRDHHRADVGAVHLHPEGAIAVRARDPERDVVDPFGGDVHRVFQPLARPYPSDHVAPLGAGHLDIDPVLPVLSSLVLGRRVVVGHPFATAVVVLGLDQPWDRRCSRYRGLRRRRRRRGSDCARRRERHPVEVVVSPGRETQDVLALAQGDRGLHVGERVPVAGVRDSERRRLLPVNEEFEGRVAVGAGCPQRDLVGPRLLDLDRVLEPLSRPVVSDNVAPGGGAVLDVDAIAAVRTPLVLGSGVEIAHVLAAAVVVLDLDRPRDHAVAGAGRQFALGDLRGRGRRVARHDGDRRHGAGRDLGSVAVDRDLVVLRIVIVDQGAGIAPGQQDI